MRIITLSFLLLTGILTSCSHEPGEYCSLNGTQYNQVDIPIDRAWQRSIEVLSSRWEIVSNDTVDKTLVVRTFYHDVEVTFKSLTQNTCEFEVCSRSYLVKPNKAAVKSVYLELDRALKNLEN